MKAKEVKDLVRVTITLIVDLTRVQLALSEVDLTVVVEAMVANVNNEISLKPSETDKSKQKKRAGKNVARKIEFKSPGPADKPKGANNNVAPEHKSAANKETNEFFSDGVELLVDTDNDDFAEDNLQANQTEEFSDNEPESEEGDIAKAAEHGSAKYQQMDEDDY